MPDPDSSINFLASDLASGDSKALSFPRSDLEIYRIQSSQHPHFPTAYQRLWEEFGPQHEMESIKVIAERLAWRPVARIGDYWMRYEMFLILREGKFVGVRDHTAIVSARNNIPHAILHLSHILVDPLWRRTGVAGWLRALPIQTARACLEAVGFPASSRITLVLEMEQPDPRFEKAMIRIKAYEKAGFKKVDPAAINYVQPDFRSPQEIDATGVRPIPFALLLRRLGREEEQTVSGAEIREIVESLYAMYGASCRQKDMAPLRELLDDYPSAGAVVDLTAPSRRESKSS